MKSVIFPRLMSLLSAIVIVSAMGLGGFKSAEAADLKILVVNQVAVFQKSLAGKDEATKLQALFKTIQEEEAKEMEPLKQEAVNLQQQKAILSADDFAQKQMELQRKVQFTQYKYEQERKVSQERSQRLIVQQLYPIFNEIMQERKGTMLIDQSQIIMTSPDFNITDDVVKRLDAKMPKADVKRVTWAEIAAAVDEQRKQMQQAQQGSGN